MPLIDVSLGARSYPILVVPSDKGELARLVKSTPHGRLFVISDHRVWALHGKSITRTLTRSGKFIPLTMPVTESSKTAETVARIQNYLLAEKITRDDLIVAIGGGVTSDLVGYAAATTLRGIRWGIISTTLMGMVDAAVGGKTGVNHKLGKNLLGSVWQPSFVYANISHLATLPTRELISGAAEVIKYAGLVGGPYLDETEAYLESGDLYDAGQLLRLVTAGAALKAQVVAEDERESGIRMFLNLGHTFGHAVEYATGYKPLRHGEAVIIGLVGALALSTRIDKSSARPLARYRHLVESALRLVPPTRISPRDVLKGMQSDKKRSATRNRFVLLNKPGKVYICHSAPETAVRAAIAEMLEQYRNLGGTDAPHTRR